MWVKKPLRSHHLTTTPENCSAEPRRPPDAQARTRIVTAFRYSLGMVFSTAKTGHVVIIDQAPGGIQTGSWVRVWKECAKLQGKKEQRA